MGRSGVSVREPAAAGIKDRAAIVGIGATEFSKNSGRSELHLALEAIEIALADAGLQASEVDGLVTFVMDTNPEIEVARNLGAGDLSFFSRVDYGGGAGGGCILQAALAVATGVADVVVVYRAFNERSGRRFGQGVSYRPPTPTAESAIHSPHVPVGLTSPAQWVAMFAQRMMHEHGVTTEAFGHVAVADRKHAANNPAAHFYNRPISLDDHQNSRWIAEPLRLLDCCQETDGGQALVITSVDRARHLPTAPAVIRAAAQGVSEGQHMMTSYYRESIVGLPEMGLVARQLFATAGVGPADIQTAIIYDHFTPFVLLQLEEFGFCGVGEAKDFVAGGNIELGGGLPINTNGGQLGEAYLHGMNGFAEAVRQIRGTSVNQVPDVEHVLATAGTGVPTSGVILGVDRR
jgi:acetyl-CoA acetyltransferase